MRMLSNRKREAGFTLLELMIVVGIVAILTVMALASYNFATQKTRRNAAKACLTEGAQQVERYYTTNMTYLGVGVPNCSADVRNFYTVSFNGTPSATAYELQAAPRGKQASDKCGTMSVNEVNRKQAATTDCW